MPGQSSTPTLLAPLFYHPPVNYFARLQKAKSLLAEANENYQKQTYRNRCHILTAQGVKPLVVPVKHKSLKIPIREVEIDYSQRWADIHWRTIKSGYGSAPYFVYYSDWLQDLYAQRPVLLFDLNLTLLKAYLKLLDIDIAISFTSEFRTNYPTSIVDSRNLIHPKRGTDNLLALPYVQVFGRPFAPDLSILDLLFNLGPESASYLSKLAYKI